MLLQELQLSQKLIMMCFWSDVPARLCSHASYASLLFQARNLDLVPFSLCVLLLAFDRFVLRLSISYCQF